MVAVGDAGPAPPLVWRSDTLGVIDVGAAITFVVVVIRTCAVTVTGGGGGSGLAAGE